MFKINYRIPFLFIAISLLFSCKSRKIISPPPPIKIVEKEVIETPETEPSNETIATFLSEYLNLKYKDRSFKKYMYVSVKYQRLYLIKNDSVVKKYSVSTATKGIGSVANSNKTPPGLHTIKRKIGRNVPLGGILKSRMYTGKIAKILTQKEDTDKDYVTTRIMWLQGEEPGINKGRNMDSYNRYIYIHGTPEEGLIGQPASHGCIRMKNKDVVELYNLVEEGTPILILKY